MSLVPEESAYAHNRGLEIIAPNYDAKETVEAELEIQVGIGGDIIEEGEDEDHKDQGEDEQCQDEIEQLLGGICADKIIYEMQERVDDFGQILTSVIQKESLGDSKKSVELITRIEQLKIESENTLTELYEHRYKIINAQNNQGKVTPFPFLRRIHLNND